MDFSGGKQSSGTGTRRPARLPLSVSQNERAKGAAGFHLTVAAGGTMLASMDIIMFVPTRSPKEAREFFETTLGLRFVSDDQFALVFDANGVMMRVVDVSGVADYKPAPFTILGSSVSQGGKTVKDVLRKGGTVGSF